MRMRMISKLIRYTLFALNDYYGVNNHDLFIVYLFLFTVPVAIGVKWS